METTSAKEAEISTTTISKCIPVLDFLKDNQLITENSHTDWRKVESMLINLRIETHLQMEQTVVGLTIPPCKELYFHMKVKNSEGANDEGLTKKMSVYSHFENRYGKELKESANMPCIIVGNNKRPQYLPLEMCSLIPQPCKETFSSIQSASLVENLTIEPAETKEIIKNAVERTSYNNKKFLKGFKFKINTEEQLTQVGGRVLKTPTLKVGGDNSVVPREGRWNFNNMTVYSSFDVKNWAVVNYSSKCSNEDIDSLCRGLISIAKEKGMMIEEPIILSEDTKDKGGGPVARVEKMYERLQAISRRGKFSFVLCILPGKKSPDIYGLWKKMLLCDYGAATQCISPDRNTIKASYLRNLLLKINSKVKLGGINSLLESEQNDTTINNTPTMIIGMDVSHWSSNIPSVAAVVGSYNWPLISRYRAATRTQFPGQEIIDTLYTPKGSETDDHGIIRELLYNFYTTSKGCMPEKIVVFRDGVSTSMFNQVLESELGQIREACQRFKEKYNSKTDPKFTVIVAVKNHGTKLFPSDPRTTGHVPPGTVVDTDIGHPKNNFFICAHHSTAGTIKPIRYYVLLDENKHNTDELQRFIHSLSYVYQRGSTAVSIAAPVYYAHHAAKQMGEIMQALYKTSSGKRSIGSSRSIPVPDLPRLHKDVEGSMFFC